MDSKSWRTGALRSETTENGVRRASRPTHFSDFSDDGESEMELKRKISLRSKVVKIESADVPTSRVSRQQQEAERRRASRRSGAGSLEYEDRKTEPDVRKTRHSDRKRKPHTDRHSSDASDVDDSSSDRGARHRRYADRKRSDDDDRSRNRRREEQQRRRHRSDTSS